jgi:hypothetical protein
MVLRDMPLAIATEFQSLPKLEVTPLGRIELPTLLFGRGGRTRSLSVSALANVAALMRIQELLDRFISDSLSVAKRAS